MAQLLNTLDSPGYSLEELRKRHQKYKIKINLEQL